MAKPLILGHQPASMARRRLRAIGWLLALTSLATLPIGIRACRRNIAKSEALALRSQLAEAIRLFVESGQASELPGASTEFTPPLGTCCAAGARCSPHPEWWAHPAWQALGISLDTPHWFSLAYERRGEDAVIRLAADPLCDGKRETYEVWITKAPVGWNVSELRRTSP